MGDEPCDVGPIGTVVTETFLRSVFDEYAARCGSKRHHPAGIEPVAERDERARRRAAEQNLMDFYTDPRDYRAALDAMKPAEPVPHVEAGETFARLIRRG